MEPLIVALIILAASAFFGKKKKDAGGSGAQTPTRSEPFSRNRNQGGFKRMEDYAKEIYGEFQAQTNPETDKKEQVKESAKKVVERHKVDRQKSRQPIQKAASLAQDEIGGRLSAHQKQSRPLQDVPQEESANLFPLTQSEAQKAIIYAEVFMPPKSKRRK